LPKLYGCQVGLPNCWSCSKSATSQQYFSLTTNYPPATSQQYFSLTTNQPPANSQQYSSLRTNLHQSLATSQPNRLNVNRFQTGPCLVCGIIFSTFWTHVAHCSTFV
jgi:hypothetical protein